MPTDEPTKATEWTDGARALARYLVEHGLTINAFCKRNGLDYAGVHRALSGDRGKRVTVDFAEAIQRATGGEVDGGLWRSETCSGERPVFTPDKTTADAASGT